MMILQRMTSLRFPLRSPKTGDCLVYKSVHGHTTPQPLCRYYGLHLARSTSGLLSTSARVFSEKRSQTSLDFSLRDTALYCNEDRWHEIKEAIKINTTFIDTHYNSPVSEQQSLPTILGIHDTPGSYKDLLPVLEPLALSGNRVVILNMPGNNYTKIPAKRERPFFTHSTEERTEFLIQFLSDLDLLHIDLAIGHGAGTGPITMLMASSDVFRSALLLCPTPGHTIQQSFQNLYTVNWALKLHDRPLFRLPSRLMMKSFCKEGNIDVPFGNVEHVVRSITGYGYEYLPGLARSTSYKKSPVSYILSSDDERHSQECSFQYAELFGIQKNRFTVSDEGNPEDLGYLATKPRLYLKSGIELKKSGHSPQFNDYYRDVIITESTRLLKEVKW